MRRPLFTSVVTCSFAFGALSVVLATPALAQAPSRPAAGWYYDYAPPPPTPARAVTGQPSSEADYRSASLAPAASGDYYYPAQRPATPPARDYYAPAAGYPARAFAPVRVAPAPSRERPGGYQPRYQPRPRPGDDDDYAYKS